MTALGWTPRQVAELDLHDVADLRACWRRYGPPAYPAQNALAGFKPPHSPADNKMETIRRFVK